MIPYYNENENRAYPVAENTTRTASDGVVLPDAVVVDLQLNLPRSKYGTVYFSSIVVTPGIVAVALATASGGIAAGAWAQPITPYVPYALGGLANMVSGHIVFGAGVSEQIVRFISGNLATSGVDDRTLRPVEDAVVLSLGRYGAQNNLKLTGIVRLVAGSNITVRYDGGSVKVGLAEAVRSEFVGPCDQQAILNNCGYPAIRTINGVGADSNGAVTIEVDNN